MKAQRLPDVQLHVQGEPEFDRWDAILKAEYAEMESGRSGAKAHLDLMTDKSGLAERFESLGAMLRVKHACNCGALLPSA